MAFALQNGAGFVTIYENKPQRIGQLEKGVYFKDINSRTYGHFERIR